MDIVLFDSYLWQLTCPSQLSDSASYLRAATDHVMPPFPEMIKEIDGFYSTTFVFPQISSVSCMPLLTKLIKERNEEVGFVWF